MTEPNHHPTDTATRLAQAERYLQQDPGNPSLMLRAVDLALACGAFGKAEALIETALRMRSEDPGSLFRRAELSAARGHWTDAQAQYQALARQYDDIHIASGLARARAECGDYPGCVDALWARRHDGALTAAAATQLVRALHHIGRGADAVDYARECEPRFGQAPMFLAAASLAALDEAQLDLARSWSARAQAGGQAPTEALVVDGTVGLGRLDVAASIATFQRVLSVRPDEARSLAGLGTAYLIQRDFAAARVQLEAAHRGMPGHIGTLHLLAWCKLFMGDPAGARHDFERALELDRNFADSHGGLAVVLAMQGERDAADEAIKRALRLDPDALSARYAKMILDGDTQDPARFAVLAERMLERRPAGEGMSMAGLLRRYRAS